MRFKRILSSALTAVIVITTIISAAPIQASAMHSAVIDTTSKYTVDEIKANILEKMLSYNFDSADQMLAYELEEGYLDYIQSADKKYSLYANRYTGVVYYVNNVTGQILTTNPINPSYTKLDPVLQKQLMSQVYIDFSTVGSIAASKTYNSYDWAASYGQISVSPIESGLRINYTLGDTSMRFLLPECISAESYENDLLIPMINTVQNAIAAACKDSSMTPAFNYLNSEGEIGDAQRDSYGMVDLNKLKTYLQGLSGKLDAYCKPETVSELSKMITDAITLFTINYACRNPEKYDPVKDKERLDGWIKDHAITAEGVAVYVIATNIKNDEQGHQKRMNANRLRSLCPEYTFSMMYEQENYCGISVKSIDKPLFRCAIEYSLNADGTLSVELPTNSITYDETVYVMNSIIVNKFFGCGDMTEDGYIFYPDGSGTIVEFSDFYSDINSERQNATLTGSVYGYDYAYSKITGAHRENVIMPVYGMVSTQNSTALTSNFTSKDKVSGGFFTIIEEGDSLSKLCFETGGAAHKFASIYPIYQPYASDTFDLSTTLSVSGLSVYTIFAAERYSGNYSLRIKMLSDSEVGAVADPLGYYEASYVGMAAYYRNYLKDLGVITKLDSIKEDLPLYVEALGSMEITAKILTFPVTTAIPLTRFEDIETMYEEFADAVNKIKQKAEEYKALAQSEDKDAVLKAKYQEKAENYERLSTEIQNITNINFRLTGFANGGVKSTYPVKTKWERACGGVDGLRELIKTANSYNGENSTFGIFPDFDFLYISRTAAFDGVSNQKNASVMIDNRYASKQTYNHITREFESIFVIVVANNTINDLYTKFEKSYSEIGHKKLSVSTLGSDLNSSFNSENVVDREEAKHYAEALLDRMANTDGYELMINSGNAYALRYATHVIDMPIDSSHFRYSSYSIPFIGLVLHGYVNYTGSALNYSGSDGYEILRSIENGASLYYILCYDNTNYMKDDRELSKYFGVDYFNWFDSIVENYSKINAAIGDLQSYQISDHKVIYAERKLPASERLEVFERLGAEFVDFADKQIYAGVNAAFDDMIADPANRGRGVKVTVDVDSLIAQAAARFNIDAEELLATDFDEKLLAVVDFYEMKYNGEGSTSTPYAVDFDEVVYDSADYKSEYDYVTISACTDKNYDTTDFTCDIGNVVLVTYTADNGHSVSFILNYNIYDVDVRLEDGTVITLGKYDFERIG